MTFFIARTFSSSVAISRCSSSIRFWMIAVPTGSFFCWTSARFCSSDFSASRDLVSASVAPASSYARFALASSSAASSLSA
jgi:hypothetical protein